MLLCGPHHAIARIEAGLTRSTEASLTGGRRGGPHRFLLRVVRAAAAAINTMPTVVGTTPAPIEGSVTRAAVSGHDRRYTPTTSADRAGVPPPGRPGRAATITARTTATPSRTRPHSRVPRELRERSRAVVVAACIRPVEERQSQSDERGDRPETTDREDRIEVDPRTCRFLAFRRTREPRQHAGDAGGRRPHTTSSAAPVPAPNRGLGGDHDGLRHRGDAVRDRHPQHPDRGPRRWPRTPTAAARRSRRRARGRRRARPGPPDIGAHGARPGCRGTGSRAPAAASTAATIPVVPVATCQRAIRARAAAAAARSAALATPFADAGDGPLLRRARPAPARTTRGWRASSGSCRREPGRPSGRRHRRVRGHRPPTVPHTAPGPGGSVRPRRVRPPGAPRPRRARPDRPRRAHRTRRAAR